MSILTEFEEKEFSLVGFYKAILFDTSSTLKYISKVKFDQYVIWTVVLQVAIVLLEKVNWLFFYDDYSRFFHYMTLPTVATSIVLLLLFSVFLFSGLRIFRVSIRFKELLVLMVYSSIPFLLFNILSCITGLFLSQISFSTNHFSTEIKGLGFAILLWCYYILYQGLKLRFDNKEVLGVLLVVCSLLAYVCIYFMIKQEVFIRYLF